jgi:protein involved in polysaccharide export with SLBB domain
MTDRNPSQLSTTSSRQYSANKEHHMRVWPLVSVAALGFIEAAHRASIDMRAELLGFWNDRRHHVRSILAGTRRAFVSWSWLVLPIAVVCLLVVPRSGGLAGPVGSHDYVLGSQDKVRLKVFEWRASRDEIFEWAAFNAEYTVGQGGKISLPLVGDVLAAGKSATDLSQAIGQALQARIGLVEPPSISVEVVQFRPFYIVGDVERPGEYAYRPGLTLLQAITIAGGVPRSKNGPARLEREAIATRGDLRLLETDLVATLVRKARLSSELQASDEIAIPDELSASASEGFYRSIVSHERLLFQSRKESFATQVRALEQLKAQHEMEAASLVKQLEMHDSLIELLKPELETVLHLYKQQLVTATRKLAVERNANQLQADRLRLETALARARQEASKTEIAMIDLQNKRSTEINAELRQSQARLNELNERIETAQRLLYDTEVTAPRFLAVRNRPKEAQPTYAVVRVISGRPIELEANEATQIEPGDTIKIELPQPGGGVQLEEAREAREARQSGGPHFAGSWTEKR